LDFFLVDEILPILAQHHGCPPSFTDISAKVLESREEAKRQKDDAIRARAERISAHKQEISRAMKDARILIREAQRCPRFRYAVKEETGDVGRVVSEVSNFLADLVSKSLWMKDFASQISEKDYVKDVLEMTKTFSKDDSYSSQRAKDETLTIVEKFERIQMFPKVLERFLLAKSSRVPEPFRKQIVVRGLEWIRKSQTSFKFTVIFRAVSSQFDDYIDSLIKNTKIVEALVLSNHYCTLKKLSDRERFQMHDQFQKSYTTYSTGPEYKRVFHIISDDFWDDVFPVHLPNALVREFVDPLYTKVRRPINKKINKRPEKRYYCNECGKSLEREEVLVSVYHSGLWCEECVEADEDLAGSKWENL
jgi:hypothetical protein